MLSEISQWGYHRYLRTSWFVRFCQPSLCHQEGSISQEVLLRSFSMPYILAGLTSYQPNILEPTIRPPPARFDGTQAGRGTLTTITDLYFGSILRMRASLLPILITNFLQTGNQANISNSRVGNFTTNHGNTLLWSANECPTLRLQC